VEPADDHEERPADADEHGERRQGERQGKAAGEAPGHV
jgi:hypothetical protein